MVLISAIIAVTIVSCKNTAVEPQRQTTTAAAVTEKPTEKPKKQPNSVSVGTPMLTIGIGENADLQAHYDGSQPAEDATYSSDRAGVVTIDEAAGRVTGKVEGGAVVTVKSANNKTAQELKCNKIALGHHQDDILQTTLMGLFYQGQFGSMPAFLKMRKMPLAIIRPLCMEKEEDLQAFAQIRGYQKQVKHCPYEHASHRHEIKKLLDQIEKMTPEVRSCMWRALNKEGKLTEQ